jgi:hypothetical protein
MKLIPVIPDGDEDDNSFDQAFKLWSRETPPEASPNISLATGRRR